MVEPDDTELNGYTNYPQLTTAVRVLGAGVTTATEGVSGGGGIPTVGGTIQGGSEATEPTEGGSGGGEPTGGGTGQGSGGGPASYLDLLSKNFASLITVFNQLYALLRY